LKLASEAGIVRIAGVAVFMTAWIEIFCFPPSLYLNYVAVFMTAWIEILIVSE